MSNTLTNFIIDKFLNIDVYETKIGNINYNIEIELNKIDNHTSKEISKLRFYLYKYKIKSEIVENHDYFDYDYETYIKFNKDFKIYNIFSKRSRELRKKFNEIKKFKNNEIKYNKLNDILKNNINNKECRKIKLQKLNVF